MIHIMVWNMHLSNKNGVIADIYAQPFGGKKNTPRGTPTTTTSPESSHGSAQVDRLRKGFNEYDQVKRFEGGKVGSQIAG